MKIISIKEWDKLSKSDKIIWIYKNLQIKDYDEERILQEIELGKIVKSVKSRHEGGPGKDKQFIGDRL